jgi:hypothetical protein
MYSSLKFYYLYRVVYKIATAIKEKMKLERKVSSAAPFLAWLLPSWFLVGTTVEGELEVDGVSEDEGAGAAVVLGAGVGAAVVGAVVVGTGVGVGVAVGVGVGVGVSVTEQAYFSAGL